MLASCTPHGGATTRYRVLRARVDLQFVRERMYFAHCACFVAARGTRCPEEPARSPCATVRRQRRPRGSGPPDVLLQSVRVQTFVFLSTGGTYGLAVGGPDRRADLLARSPRGIGMCMQCLDAEACKIWERGGQGGREHFGSGEGYDSGGEMDPGGDLMGESESLRQGWPSLDGFCHSVRACPWIFARGFDAAQRLQLLLEREDDEVDAAGSARPSLTKPMVCARPAVGCGVCVALRSDARLHLLLHSDIARLVRAGGGLLVRFPRPPGFA